MTLLNHQHLYYFWVVAKEGSITKACQRLYLAQPTVSGQLIQFEKTLGKKLFERRKQRLLLTRDGRTVLRYAEAIFAKTQELLHVLKNEDDAKVRIHLGVDTDVSKQVGVQLLKTALHRYPKAEIHVLEGDASQLMRRIQRYTIDLILSSQGGILGETRDLIRVELGRFPISFVASPAVARQVKHYPNDLSQGPLIIPATTSPLWDSIQHYLIQHRVESSTFVEIQDAELMRLAALEGLGAAPLNEIAIVNDLKKGALIRLNKKPTGIVKTLWLIARRDLAKGSPTDYLFNHFKPLGL